MNKKCILICSIFFLLLGYAYAKSPNLYDPPLQNQVPKEFLGDVGHRDNPSEAEMYLERYRDGWWQCVENYVKNIDYVSRPSDTIVSGHGSEISGYSVGYKEAEKRIKANIKKYGKEKTHKYLEELWEGW